MAQKDDYTDFDPETLSAASCTVSSAYAGEGRYTDYPTSKYGHVKVILSPHPGVHCFRFLWDPLDAALPLPFMRSACFGGVKRALLEPLDDGRQIAFVQVSVVDGSYHEVDTDEQSLGRAAFLAVRDALARATFVSV